jgi:hypothetical protein
MSGGYRSGKPPTELADFIQELDEINARLDTLERPTAEATYQTVAKLKALVEDIQAQLTDFIDNDVTTIVDQRISIALASWFAGNVTIGGALRVNGDVIVPKAHDTNVSGTTDHVAAWIAGGGDGRLGTA